MKTIRIFTVNLLFIMLATIFVGCEGLEANRIIGDWKLVKETYTYEGQTETYISEAPYTIYQFNEDGTWCIFDEDEIGEQQNYRPYLLDGKQITIDGETFNIVELSKNELILSYFAEGGSEAGTTLLLYFERYY